MYELRQRTESKDSRQSQDSGRENIGFSDLA